ncbi:Tricarboxylate carrier family protein [Candida albicans]|uniref:Tricarboxylate carrier family protein n=1 Tax=Candida albicans TaxID=5476 RepID=A0A8H6BUQ3_CANAX|nr:Tricarboxylate carrier family protein [Candida albicans]
MLLNTTHDIETAKRMVWDYKNGVTSKMSPELWRAKKVLDSTLHPDTGETVFLPFRMSSCVLSNLVVTAGMLTPNLGTAGTLFWQIANQSLNVAINTANANKSHPLTTKQIVTNYTLAVSASCSVALGLNSLVPRLKSLKPNTRMILGRLVPFAAVVSAGIVNVFLMRSEELKKGITVFDRKGNEVGTSKQQPGKSKGVETLVNIGLIFATSLVALPFALAVFPQRRVLAVNKLESKFHELKDKDGNDIKELEFNRGI